MSNSPVRDHYLTYLSRTTLPVGHLEVWKWFRDRIPWYDTSAKHPSWVQAKRKDPRRPVAMAGFGAGVRADDSRPSITSLRVIGDRCDMSVSAGEAEPDAMRVAETLFGTHTRQTSIVVPDGSAWVFDAILRQYARTWVRAGWTIQPLVAGHQVKAVIVRNGRYRWTLSDFDGMTGTSPETALTEARADGLCPRQPQDDLRLLLAWVVRLQTVVHAELGTYLRPTVGGTAVRAVAYDLPDGQFVPRVQPLLVAMCRVARGFRGGYIYGERYRGPAFKVDVRRMYAWALSQPLGFRWALGPCVTDGSEADGIFLCTVSGTPQHPVQLATWRDEANGFTAELWPGGSAICVLPTSEFAGLRALGVTVEASFGFVATRSLTFKPFVSRLQEVITRHGSESPAGRYAKLAGNTLYGRLAVNPHREGVVFSEERPEGVVFPLVTVDGERLDNLWHVEGVHHAPSQQVSMAAQVTGFARTKLYECMAQLIGEGHTIVHAHTDGLVVTGTPPAWLTGDTDQIGAWRLISTDDDAIVARSGGYAIGGEAKWSGAPSQGRRTIEVAWSRGDWLVAGRRARPDRA